jgi:lambda repressor-like predicted transcriptional regulator
MGQQESYDVIKTKSDKWWTNAEIYAELKKRGFEISRPTLCSVNQRMVKSKCATCKVVMNKNNRPITYFKVKL